MKHAKGIAAAVSAACLLSSQVAAQPAEEHAGMASRPSRPHSGDLGQKGDIAVSVDRLTGLQIVYVTGFDEGAFSTPSTVTTSISLLGSSSNPVFVPSAFPRISIDAFPADNFTLGGAILGDYTGVNNDNGHGWFLGGAVRAGMLMPINDSADLWPRAGLTFTYGDAEGALARGAGTLQEYLLAVNLEVPIVVKMVDHFGGTITAFADIPLMTQTAVGGGDFSNSASIWTFGVTLGTIGWF